MGHPEDPFLHSERFVLVDRKGRIRGWYHGMDADSVAALIRDLDRLEGERP
jgi:hypothetical protein